MFAGLTKREGVIEGQTRDLPRPTKPQMCSCGRLADPNPLLAIPSARCDYDQASPPSIPSVGRVARLEHPSKRIYAPVQIPGTGPSRSPRKLSAVNPRRTPPRLAPLRTIHHHVCRSNHLGPSLDPSRPSMSFKQISPVVDRGARPSCTPQSYAAGAGDFVGLMGCPLLILIFHRRRLDWSRPCRRTKHRVEQKYVAQSAGCVRYLCAEIREHRPRPASTLALLPLSGAQPPSGVVPSWAPVAGPLPPSSRHTRLFLALFPQLARLLFSGRLSTVTLFSSSFLTLLCPTRDSFSFETTSSPFITTSTTPRSRVDHTLWPILSRSRTP